MLRRSRSHSLMTTSALGKLSLLVGDTQSGKTSRLHVLRLVWSVRNNPVKQVRSDAIVPHGRLAGSSCLGQASLRTLIGCSTMFTIALAPACLGSTGVRRHCGSVAVESGCIVCSQMPVA
ncbi:hypothetical protein BU23DRAFT_228546 [Bimuria novae-zelandiae CBS 107.79]|uniref:Uncharacterized protein n=1 Tax=Bimuria novae-zelandiae CBS 107.79 TaxID=1447943 RepID=A0A6A5VS98_9PLEO|nr:hypothetical protein BU23DRAFT_228546 [Bimuria novae-zelandiae CBS 107.79]